MIASRSSVVVCSQETSPEVRTVAGYLAGFSGRKREADASDVVSSGPPGTSAKPAYGHAPEAAPNGRLGWTNTLR